MRSALRVIDGHWAEAVIFGHLLSLIVIDGHFFSLCAMRSTLRVIDGH